MGNVRIWDTMVKETSRNFALQSTNAWANRSGWQQIPYGTTGNITFTGNAIIEEEGVYWWLLPTDPTRSGGLQPLIWANLNGTPSAATATYVYAVVNNSQTWDYYHYSFQIIQNQPDEIVFVRTSSSTGALVMKVRLKSNSNLIEMTPQNNYVYNIGLHHSPGRVALAVNSYGNDFVKDKDLDNPSSQNNLKFTIPENTQYGLYEITNADSSMMVIPSDIISSDYWIELDATDYRKIYRMISKTSPAIQNKITYMAVINQYNVFRYELPNKSILSGGSYTTSFKPAITGKWRISGRVNNIYYTQIVELLLSGNLVFISPVSGTLQEVVMYLYDRNNSTPTNVKTPQEIYWSIIGSGCPSPSFNYTITEI